MYNATKEQRTEWQILESPAVVWNKDVDVL